MRSPSPGIITVWQITEIIRKIMVISCAAIGCTNRRNKNTPDIHFHRYPLSKPDTLNKWIAATRREKWYPTKYSFLCSEHFKKECYEPKLAAGRMYLKEGAVPDIFNYRERLRRVVRKRRPVNRISTPTLPIKESTTGWVKEEPVFEFVPVQSIKDEPPQVKDEPDYACDMLTVKMEPKEEIVVEENSIMLGNWSCEASCWNSYTDVDVHPSPSVERSCQFR